MSVPSGPHASLLVALRTLICASEYPFVTFFLLKGKEAPVSIHMKEAKKVWTYTERTAFFMVCAVDDVEPQIGSLGTGGCPSNADS